MCTFAGKAASCRDRIVYVATKTLQWKPDACRLAHDVVLGHCPVCRECPAGNSGCQGLVPGTPAYDCDEHFATWQKDWSVDKKAWCCVRAQRGCPTPPAPPSGSGSCATACNVGGRPMTCREAVQLKADQNFQELKHIAGFVANPKSQPDSCVTGLSLAIEQCPACSGCSIADSGCEAPSPTGSLPYDCSAGLDNWAKGWSVGKKEWCCANKRLGCGCDADCSYKGVSAPCNERIQFAAIDELAGQADACEAALGLVRQQCSAACNQCTLADSGCHVKNVSTAPFNCDAGFDNWREGWSFPKKAWCCENKKRGCVQAEDCSGEASAWSEPKTSWCCYHEKRGCKPKAGEPYNCTDGLQNWVTGWDLQKKAWCCLKRGAGCPTDMGKMKLPYNCSEDFDDWMAKWSLNKKAWCCKQESRGCLADEA